MVKFSKPKLKDLRIVFNSNEMNDVCFNNEDYWSLKKDWDNLKIEMIDRRYDLKRGLYANIGHGHIWVNKNIPKGHIRIYPKEKSPESIFDSEWSIDIKISNFEKMINLKAFW